MSNKLEIVHFKFIQKLHADGISKGEVRGRALGGFPDLCGGGTDKARKARVWNAVDMNTSKWADKYISLRAPCPQNRVQSSCFFNILVHTSTIIHTHISFYNTEHEASCILKRNSYEPGLIRHLKTLLNTKTDLLRRFEHFEHFISSELPNPSISSTHSSFIDSINYSIIPSSLLTLIR